MTISATQIANAILTNGYDSLEMTAIVEAINFVRRRAAQTAKRRFMVGDEVVFTNSRNGLDVRGVVTKLGPKNVFVRAPGNLGPTNWRVSPTLLRAA